MITGVGLDIVDVGHIRGSIQRFGCRFTRRIFSDAEIAYCESMPDPAMHYSARFAAREAFRKATGAAGELLMRDVEVELRPGGAPAIRLRGRAAERFRGGRAHLSLTHEKNCAAAVVVIETSDI